MKGSLTWELTAEHVELLSEFDAVAALGIATAEGRRRLEACRKMLTSHMEKEDRLLYPELRKRADDPKVRWALDFFDRDLQQVSAAVREFFDRLDAGRQGFELAADYGRLVARVRARARKEETGLFPEYVRAVESPPSTWPLGARGQN